MSQITGAFVTALAKVWHRFEPADADAQTLSQMLAPMDDAGEVMAQSVAFDMEPADFLAGLDAMAMDRDDP